MQCVGFPLERTRSRERSNQTMLGRKLPKPSFRIQPFQFPKTTVEFPNTSFRIQPSSFRIQPVSFRMQPWSFRIQPSQFPNTSFRIQPCSFRIPVSEYNRVVSEYHPSSFRIQPSQFPNTSFRIQPRSFRIPVSEYNRSSFRIQPFQFPNTTVQFPNTTVTIQVALLVPDLHRPWHDLPLQHSSHIQQTYMHLLHLARWVHIVCSMLFARPSQARSTSSER